MTLAVGDRIVVSKLPVNVGRAPLHPPRIAKVVALDPVRVRLQLGAGQRARWHKTPRTLTPANGVRLASARECELGFVCES